MCCLNFLSDWAHWLLEGGRPRRDRDIKTGGGGGVRLDINRGVIGGIEARLRGEGRVTTECLWHACRAVTVGVLLVITGLVLTVIGEK